MKQNKLALIIIAVLITLASYAYFTNKSNQITNVNSWLNYTDSEHNLNFMYPYDWVYEVSESNGSYSIKLKDSKKDYYVEESIISPISIIVTKFSGSSSINNWLQNWKITREKYNGSVQDTKTSKGIDATKGSDYLGTYILIQHDSSVYSINKANLGYEDSYIDEVYQNIVDSFETLR